MSVSGPVSASAAIDGPLRAAAIAREPDRYVAATLAPLQARPALAAIAGFAAELARISGEVSDPMLGQIRLQWWRDALDGGRDGRTTGHPVADALIATKPQHGLDGGLVTAMIDARELDCACVLPENDAVLFAYLDATEGHAFRLALAALGYRGDEPERLIRPAARAYGLARALAEMPRRLRHGVPPFTADRLRMAGIEPTLLASRPPATEALVAMARVATDMRALAEAAMDEARALVHALPRSMRLAFLPLAMVRPYLRAHSEAPDFEHMVEISPFARVVRLGFAHLRGL